MIVSSLTMKRYVLGIDKTKILAKEHEFDKYLKIHQFSFIFAFVHQILQPAETTIQIAVDDKVSYISSILWKPTFDKSKLEDFLVYFDRKVVFKNDPLVLCSQCFPLSSL